MKRSINMSRKMSLIMNRKLTATLISSKKILSIFQNPSKIISNKKNQMKFPTQTAHLPINTKITNMNFLKAIKIPNPVLAIPSKKPINHSQITSSSHPKRPKHKTSVQRMILFSLLLSC